MGEMLGARVEIPAHADMWMRGDRYGIVVDVTSASLNSRTGTVKVRLDKSGFIREFQPASLTVIGSVLVNVK